MEEVLERKTLSIAILSFLREVVITSNGYLYKEA
jgi:hypothetical protein